MKRTQSITRENGILLATGNAAKVDRLKRLAARAGIDVVFYTPAELGIDEIDVVEDGATLAENAKRKARAYLGKVALPILANDTGFWTETEGFVEAPRRHALCGADEAELSKEEIADRLLTFWKEKATANGGRVDAAWIESFVLIYPNGVVVTADARRDIILTDTTFGDSHIQFPLRALYISKTTNKPSILHTEEEEFEELQPIVDAIKKLFPPDE